MSFEYSQAVNRQTRARRAAETVSYCGHHYFNPQWVYQDQNMPSLMYNNAVYFTVSDDGTHYFHQSYKGEFYPVFASTMDNKSRRPKSSPPPFSGNEHIDRKIDKWTNHRQISLNPSWSTCSFKPSQPQHPRKRKDVRSTIVPMFPEAFSLGTQRSNTQDDFLDGILMNSKIGLKFEGERPGKLR